MPTKIIGRVVHDGQPERPDMKDTASWMAPATPHGTKPTGKEQRIIDAHRRGADLDQLVRSYHTPPAVLFKVLGLNPAEHAELFAKLTAEFNDLRARSLR